MKMTRILEVPDSLQAPIVAVQQADPYLLTALAFTFFGLVLVIHTRLQRVAAARQAEKHEQTLDALATAMGKMSDNMRRMDSSLQRLIQRVDQLQISNRGSGDLRQAEHLLRDGASTDQLVDLCGMSRGEAELFQRLHS
ncbi:MAG: DUF2802 domain-containing protein [Gammaproteobacteria bacterium]|nr:DUF2802 domain-containing protein [Gammaproteobacteria bacterium]